MFKFLKFIKTYPGILYSLFLIIFIPLVFYLVTLFSVNAFQKNINSVLQTKAILAENIINVFTPGLLSQPNILERKIEQITKENPEIKKLRFIKQENGEFKIIASQDPKEIGAFISDPSLAISWSQGQATAKKIKINGTRFWRVDKPIFDPQTGKKIGIVSLALSLEQSDLLITRLIHISYAIVIIANVLILFLILQHTRLFSYVALYKKLQEVDRMKDEFIRMATHELRSPIINIRGYIEVLSEKIEPSLDEEEKEYLRRIDISAKNLGNLIDDILQVSRIQQGRLDITPKRIQPETVIKEVIKELELKAQKKGLKLVFQPREEPLYIMANPNRLREIIFNLVNNAIKYTPKGWVKIETQADKIRKKYHISVVDTGIGISAQAQTKLFQKFYRVRTRETADIPGTGLGLWISKELCQKMGGQIFLESMEGKGSKFTLIFPLAS
ncbi:HAMP domain-containing histidine kinase [bacterium]|nr:HAMP domain-containing histidine kinase [bacterium]